MARFFGPDEIDSALIKGSSVAVLGYGNQGRAQALNLRDSGVPVTVGAREGAGAGRARQDGFDVLAISEATASARFVVMALPDLDMGAIFSAAICPALQPGAVLVFVHGFALRYGLVRPPSTVDVVLVGPKGAGAKLREEYEQGRGLACLIAVHQDVSGQALSLALAYAWGLGCARSAILETSVAEETETDLFGEQAVLCGGIPSLIEAAFDRLVAAGYQPEVAYFECLHEAKLITDLIYSRGLAGMRQAISETALWGGLAAGPKVVNEASLSEMDDLLARIRDGRFAEGWKAEKAAGAPNLAEALAGRSGRLIEEVGADLRRRMGL